MIFGKKYILMQGKAAKSSERQYSSSTLHCKKNSDGFEFCYDGYKAVSRTHKESAAYKKLYKQYDEASGKLYKTALNPYVIEKNYD